MRDTFEAKGKRKKMVADLREKGITDEDVLRSIDNVPRHLFMDPAFLNHAYVDKAFPISSGQTISQPYTVAVQTSLLRVKKRDKILEIGTGSGYSTALISSMVSKVLTIDINEKLASIAKNRLISSGFFNIKFLGGDCSELDDTAGVFDAVIVHAGCMHSPYAALNLLKRNGIAVFPMGTAMLQQITFYKNANLADGDNPFKRYKFLETCQVPSIKGQYGYTNAEIDIIFQPGKE